MAEIQTWNRWVRSANSTILPGHLLSSIRANISFQFCKVKLQVVINFFALFLQQVSSDKKKTTFKAEKTKSGSVRRWSESAFDLVLVLADVGLKMFWSRRNDVRSRLRTASSDSTRPQRPSLAPGAASAPSATTTTTWTTRYIFVAVFSLKSRPNFWIDFSLCVALTNYGSNDDDEWKH